MTKKSDAPAIRFKGFSDAWEQREVGDLLIERSQQAPMSDEYPLMAFIANEGVAPKGERYDRSALVTDTVNKLYKKTEKGDFIYSSNNLETGSIGLNKYGKACISPVYSIFEPTGIADSDFLGRRLVRKDFINAMVKWRQGVIYGQWRIHESDFLKIEISVPSVEEQRKIGAYLDQLDNLITLHQRKCVFLFGFFQAYISMIFTASTFSWEQRKLGDVVKEITRNDPESEAPIMMITANNGFIEQSERYAFNNAGESLKKYILLKKGELAYNHGASKLRPYGSCFALTTAENARIPFVYHCFSAENQNAEFMSIELNGAEIENQLRKIVSSGARMDGLLNISFDEYTSVSVILPGTEEQDRIADFFRHLDNLITLHQRQSFSHSTPDISLSVQLIHPFYTSSWEQRKAIDIADYSKGNGYSKGDLTDAGTPIILYGRLYTKYQFAISEVDTFAFPRNGAVYSQGNEVIVPASGETAEDIARASAVEKSGVLLGGDLNILRPFDFINPLFLALAISNGEPQKELAKKAQGKSVVHIHNTDIQEVTIAYPSRTEQDRIVSVFRQLDNLITLHQRKGKAAVSGCSNDANNSKGVCCKARDFGYKCHKKDESK